MIDSYTYLSSSLASTLRLRVPRPASIEQGCSAYVDIAGQVSITRKSTKTHSLLSEWLFLLLPPHGALMSHTKLPNNTVGTTSKR